MNLNPSPEFVDSYPKFETYPCHGTEQGLSPYALDAYKKRFASLSSTRFVANEVVENVDKTNIVFLDSPAPGSQGQLSQ
jgi:hypothetical protein